MITKERKREYDEIYRKTHQEEIKEKDKEYYQTHKEERDKYQKKYNKTHNKEKTEQQKRDINELQRINYHKNKEKRKETRKKYVKNNFEHINELRRISYKKNPKKIKERSKKYYIKNIDKRIKYAKEYYKINKEKIKEYRREYRQTHKEERNKNEKERLKNDPNYKLTHYLRNRLFKSIKNNYKSGSAVQDLGCTIDELKIHLEKQFKEGMNWENWVFKGWHIDHIVPLCSFNLMDREQLLIAVNYKNLQPLWWYDNLSKSSKLLDNVKKI